MSLLLVLGLVAEGFVLLVAGLLLLFEGLVLLDGLLVLFAPVSELAVPEGAAPVVPAARVVPREADPGFELPLPVPQWSEISVTLLTWNVFCAPELLVELELLGY